MEQFLNELTANGFDISSFLITALLFAAGSLLFGFCCRIIYGSNSALSHAISSAIGILFIYFTTITVISIGGELEQFKQFLSPLPFVTIRGDLIELFLIDAASHQEICQQILSMLILAFLVNFLDSWVPRGNSILIWFFWRCTTVILAILTHWFIEGFLSATVTDTMMQNASTILLAVLALMLAVGFLKFIVGAALAMFNPIIGALYTFFFANIIGKQVTKAVVSTALLTTLVWGLTQVGVTVLSISTAALMAYLPFIVILLVVWYVVNRIL